MRPESCEALSNQLCRLLTWLNRFLHNLFGILHHSLQDGEEQIILAAEVIAQSSLIDTGLGGDFTCRGCRKPITREHANSGSQNIGTAVGCSGRSSHRKSLIGKKFIQPVE